MNPLEKLPAQGRTSLGRGDEEAMKEQDLRLGRRPRACYYTFAQELLAFVKNSDRAPPMLADREAGQCQNYNALSLLLLMPLP